MLNQQSMLTSDQVQSPLLQASTLGPRKKGRKHLDLAPVLSLTSLIDAFSIIVIYLLIGTTSSQVEIQTSPKIELPQAEKANPAEEAQMIKIEDGRYFINDEIVLESDLGKKLFELKEKLNNPELPVIVQADHRVDFEKINPLLLAANQAGLQKIKFAVVPVK